MANRRVAVIDGFGATAEVFLYEVASDDSLVDLPWPEGWPICVSARFFTREGFCGAICVRKT